MRLLTGARHQAVGADRHRRATEEPLDGRLVAVVGDDADLAQVLPVEIEHRLEGAERVEVGTAGGARHVAETLSEEGLADTLPHAGDLNALEPAAETDEVVPGGGVAAHPLVHRPSRRRIAQPGQEPLAGAGAHVRREYRVAGGAPRGVGVHVLHRRDACGRVGENVLEGADLVVVARAGDLAVFVAVAAAAVDRCRDHLFQGVENPVAFRAQMRKQRPRLDLVEGADQGGDLALVGIDRGIVNEAGGQPQGPRGFAPDDRAHVLDLGIGGDAGEIGHHHPAHGAVPQIHPEVGHRPPAMPVVELGDRRPRPVAVDVAVQRFQLNGVFGPLLGRHRRRRQAVDAADPFGHPTEEGKLAGNRHSVRADPRAAQGAVIVGVDEARRQHPSASVDHPIGAPRLRFRDRTETEDPIVLDQHVAGIGLRDPVAADDQDVTNELAHGLHRSPRSAPRRGRAIPKAADWLRLRCRSPWCTP